ncbi:hypothetical protein JCM10908_004471 [Rhodotorula pacifica]|uniref:Dsc3p n=1 Tax=Rhodotorula pacifica TaxID=1495444 RepID=UPI003173A735
MSGYQALPLHDSSPTLYPPPRPAATSAFSTSSSSASRPSFSSAKGKGKARALPTDDDQDDEEAGEGHDGMSFGVRFTDGQTPDLVDLWVGQRETVRDLKRRIRILRPDTLVAKEVDPVTNVEKERPRRLRLIQLGRVLPDGVFVVPFTVQLNARGARGGGGAPTRTPTTEEGEDASEDDELQESGTTTIPTASSLRAVGKGLPGSVITGVSLARGSLDLAAANNAAAEDDSSLDSLEKGTAAASTGRKKGKGKGRRRRQQEAPIWLHCSVGEAMEEEELEAEATAAAAAEATVAQAAQPQITPLQGFDRLREAGFSDQDIENLRAEFRANAASSGTSPPPLPSREEIADESERRTAADEEHQQAMEEQWMSGMTGLEEAAGGGSSSGEGGHYYSLLKGVCAGFFVPFLPLFFFRTQIFSKRMQIAIVLGIFINLAFGFLRMLG